MSKTKQFSFVKTMRAVVEYVAVKKANANCWGVMYEPERPRKIVEKTKR